MYIMVHIDALREAQVLRGRRPLEVSPALWVSSTRDWPFHVCLTVLGFEIYDRNQMYNLTQVSR